MPAVTSQIGFLGPHDLAASGKPYSLRYDAPGDFPRTNFASLEHNQTIEDVRGRQDAFTLKKQGFGVLEFDPHMQYDDYDEKAKIEKVYLEQVAQALKKKLGASRVQIFDHVVRKRQAQFPIATGEGYKYDQPTTQAHIDMTPAWACAMAEHMNQRKGIELPSFNFQFVNVWKPLRGPIKDWPLALCDKSSLANDDMQEMDIVHDSTVIETYVVRKSPNQRWYYLSDQTEHEAWFFLQADSKDGGSPGVPHSSFLHPDHSKSVVPRESIEVRAIVYHEI